MKKLKQNFLRKWMSRRKDIDEITRFREMLRRSLDVYGVSISSNASDYSLIIFRYEAIYQPRNICSGRPKG